MAIRIKRSSGNTAPSLLESGQLAYAEGSSNGGTLYYGEIGGTVREIGGRKFVDKVNGIEAGAQVNTVTIYGQRFQNIVGFTVMSKVGTFQGSNGATTRDDLDAAVLCDQVIEAFEDFMLEYTSIFKSAGASELVYSRRLSDSEINREGKDVHKRTVTYMLTTEKTFAMSNRRIEQIVVDARTWMAYEKQLLRDQLATPNYEGTTGNIIDLFQTATPNV